MKDDWTQYNMKITLKNIFMSLSYVMQGSFLNTLAIVQTIPKKTRLG